MGGDVNWVRFAEIAVGLWRLAVGRGANWVRFAFFGSAGRWGWGRLGSFCIIGYGEAGETPAVRGNWVSVFAPLRRDRRFAFFGVGQDGHGGRLGSFR